MCRLEERIYISAEGHRSKFEDAFPCSKARRGRLCADVQTRTTEYFPKKAVNPRDTTPSPNNPPTPTSTGTYIVQQRRPSSGGRSSTHDGTKIKPEIIINFSGKNKKGKGYVSMSTGAYKQSSDEIAVESPGSDASHTVRTGYPEAPLPPQAPVYGHTDIYNTIPKRGYHHRHSSSTSSYTGSSQTPSLTVTSDLDFDSPSTTRLPPAIHYPSTAGPTLSPSRSRHGRSSSNEHNLTVVAPRNNHRDLSDRSVSSHTSSGASGHSQRKDHDQTRKKNDEVEENAKQVRFDLGRAEGRAKERAESQLAEKEKQRAADRNEIRQRKNREYEEEKIQSRRKEESQPPKSSSSSSSSTKPKSRSRRASASGMTSAQQKEHQRLLAAELGHMQIENKAAEEREREERAALLRQQQQDTSYYNPRVAPVSNNAPIVTHRNPTSRRDSFTSEARPTMLVRSNSRRTSMSHTYQPTSSQGATGYMQPPSARTHPPPPLSFPSNFNPRPTSARRSSISAQDNPFLTQPHFSGTSRENPFATTPSVISPTIHQDPWDARNVRETLPHPRQSADDRYLKASGTHSAVRQASRAMAMASGFEGDYTTDSDDEVTHGHHRRRRG